jgi:hypothetical protein
MSGLLCERRAFRRSVPSSASVVRVRLRAGHELCVVDLSSGGVLVEAATRLMPGATVELHVTLANARRPVRAHVARCHVAALDPLRGITYRAALAFDRPLDRTSPGPSE